MDENDQFNRQQRNIPNFDLFKKTIDETFARHFSNGILDENELKLALKKIVTELFAQYHLMVIDKLVSKHT